MLIMMKAHHATAVFDGFPDQRNRSSSINDTQTLLAKSIPQHAGIESQIESGIFPISQYFFNQGIIETRDINAIIMDPSSKTTFCTLRLIGSTLNKRYPLSGVNFTHLDNAVYHPNKCDPVSFI